MKVAIIIPIQNEEKIIRESLKHFTSVGADEVIVVDGNSSDATCRIIKEEFLSVRCFTTAFAERSFQMNLGAFESVADIFLFAHVDTRLPVDAIDLIRHEMKQGKVGGGFVKKYEPSNGLLNVYLFILNNCLLKGFKTIVGSNAIFVKREVFEKLQGFSDVPLLEDLIFTDQMRNVGQLAIIDSPVQVSSRRYLNRGPLKQILTNGRIFLGYKLFGEKPEKLRDVYQRKLSVY